MFLTELILLDIVNFDIILGMDRLLTYHATVDCLPRIITFSSADQLAFQILGTKIYRSATSLSTHSRKLLSGGCTGYLSSTISTEKAKPILEEIPIVQGYPNVFPDELPRQPPTREV